MLAAQAALLGARALLEHASVLQRGICAQRRRRPAHASERARGLSRGPPAAHSVGRGGIAAGPRANVAGVASL